MEKLSPENAVSINYFNPICRTCLCDLKKASIAFNINHLVVQKREDTGETTDIFAINQVLSKYATIQINTEDNFPKKLCQQCFGDLTHVYEFINKCQKSDKKLRLNSLNCKENLIEIKLEEPEDVPLIKREEISSSVNCFDSICRTCLCDLKEALAFNVNDLLMQKREDSTEMLAINEVLAKCASIQIYAEDSLPKNLCQRCFADLTYVYKFIKKCQKSDEILQTTSLNFDENIWIKTEEPDDVPLETENNIVEEIERKRERKQLTTSYCDYCDLEFKTVHEFREHKKTLKHPLPRNHKCPQCPKKCSSHALLIEHIRTHTKERPYSCNLCPAKFSTKCSLKRHAWRHSDEKRPQKPREKRHKCEHCSKAFVRKQRLLIHLGTHAVNTPHICNHCGKNFTQSWRLKFHIKTCPAIQNFECSICKRHLSSKRALDVHESIHKEKQFLCSQCGERFRTKYLLNVHYRVHANGKLFVCDYCGKGFKLRESLRSHTYTHTGERPYSCKGCDKRFKQLGHLRSHEKSQHER